MSDLYSEFANIRKLLGILHQNLEDFIYDSLMTLGNYSDEYIYLNLDRRGRNYELGDISEIKIYIPKDASDEIFDCVVCFRDDNGKVMWEEALLDLPLDKKIWIASLIGKSIDVKSRCGGNIDEVDW